MSLYIYFDRIISPGVSSQMDMLDTFLSPPQEYAGCPDVRVFHSHLKAAYICETTRKKFQNHTRTHDFFCAYQPNHAQLV